MPDNHLDKLKEAMQFAQSRRDPVKACNLAPCLTRLSAYCKIAVETRKKKVAAPRQFERNILTYGFFLPTNRANF